MDLNQYKENSIDAMNRYLEIKDCIDTNNCNKVDVLAFHSSDLSPLQVPSKDKHTLPHL